MAFVATSPNRVSNLVKHEYGLEHGYCRAIRDLILTPTSEIGTVFKEDGSVLHSIDVGSLTGELSILVDDKVYLLPIEPSTPGVNAIYTIDLAGLELPNIGDSLVIDGVTVFTTEQEGLSAEDIAHSLDEQSITLSDGVEYLTAASDSTLLVLIATAQEDNTRSITVEAVDVDPDNPQVVQPNTTEYTPSTNGAAPILADPVPCVVLTGGPGGSGAVVVVREQLRFGDALTEEQIDVVVEALNKQGIKVGQQV